MMGIDDMMDTIRGTDPIPAPSGRAGMIRWVDEGPLRLTVTCHDGHAHMTVRAYGLHDLTLMEARGIPMSETGARRMRAWWDMCRTMRLRAAVPRELCDTAAHLDCHRWVTACSAHGLDAARPGMAAHARPIRSVTGRVRAYAIITESVHERRCEHVSLPACLSTTACRDRLLAAMTPADTAQSRPCGDTELLTLDALRS